MADRPCPNCKTMRPEAATFCANCGQDLRPGAALGDMRPGATIVRKLPPGAPAGGVGGQRPPSALFGAAEVGESAPPAPRRSAGPRKPRLPRGRSAAKASTPAAAPTAATSFTDRYRGSQFETPEARAAAAAARGRAKLLRQAGLLVVLVAVIAVVGYGALQVLVPAASSATPSGSAVAQSSGPAATPLVTPAPAVSFTADQTAQIAFCLAATETTGLDDDIATARAAVTAGAHADVGADATGLVARLSEMGLAAREMAALPELTSYASAYDGGLKGVATAAGALAKAGAAADAKAEAKASTDLATAQAALHATAKQRTTLVTADPVLACTAAR